MSDWSLVKELLENNKKQLSPKWYINMGLGWDIFYLFNLNSNDTAYLAFETGEDIIHATRRRVKIIGLDNQALDFRITTLKNATIDEFGSEISDKIFNADHNLSNDNINLKMYDETTTISDEGTEAPYSARMKADRRELTQEFITEEYILRTNGVRVLKFENLGDGDLEVEYASTGYQEYKEE